MFREMFLILHLEMLHGVALMNTPAAGAEAALKLQNVRMVSEALRIPVNNDAVFVMNSSNEDADGFHFLFSCWSRFPNVSSLHHQILHHCIISCFDFEDVRHHVERLRSFVGQKLLFHIYTFEHPPSKYLPLFRPGDGAVLYVNGSAGESLVLVTGSAGAIYWDKLEDALQKKTFRDLQGQTLRVSMVNNTPWEIIDEKDLLPEPIISFNKLKSRTIGQTEVSDARGIDMEILKTLAQHMNFSYRLLLSSDGQWGTVGPGNIFSGMIGDVQCNLSDMAISEITMTSTRSEVIQFTTPYYYEILVFVTQQHSPTAALSFVLLRYIWIWLLIFLSLVLCSLVLWLSAKFGRYSKMKLSVGSSLLTSYQILTQQSVTRVDVGTGGRFLLSSWMFASVVIAAVYGGTLISLLATSTSSGNNLETLADLEKAVSQDAFKITTISGSAIFSLFEDAKADTLYGKIFQGMQDSIYGDPMEVLLLVLDDPELALVWASIGLEVRMNALGRFLFHKSKESFYPSSYAIALPSGSPYLNAFNERIYQLQFSGLIRKWTKDWLELSKKVQDTSGRPETLTTVNPLSMATMQGVFFILLLGLGTATVTFLVETIKPRLFKFKFNI